MLSLFWFLVAIVTSCAGVEYISDHPASGVGGYIVGCSLLAAMLGGWSLPDDL